MNSLITTLVHDSPIFSVCLSVATLANMPGAFKEIRLVAAHVCFWSANTIAVLYELVITPLFALASLVFLVSALAALAYSRWPRRIPLAVTHFLSVIWGVILITAATSEPSYAGWYAVVVFLIGAAIAATRAGRVLARPR